MKITEFVDQMKENTSRGLLMRVLKEVAENEKSYQVCFDENGQPIWGPWAF